MKNRIKFAADPRCRSCPEHCCGLWTNPLDRHGPVLIHDGARHVGRRRVPRCPGFSRWLRDEVQNVEAGHATTIGTDRSNGNPNEKTPQLVFRCGSESGCALVAMKMADGRGWSYNEPKLKASEQERIAVDYFDSKLAE